MEIPQKENSLSEFNGQNNFSQKSFSNINIPKSLTSSVVNNPLKQTNPEFFSPQNNQKNSLYFSLNNPFSSPLNVKSSNINGINNIQTKDNFPRRYKSEKTKRFLKSVDKEDDKKKLGVIKEIVLDDQNEFSVSNNPKKRFMINNEKKVKKPEEKKKMSFMEKIIDLDRRQRISMEKYISDIKKRKFENFFKKSLKNNYEEINQNFNIENICSNIENVLINGLLNQDEENIMNSERIFDTHPEKDTEINPEQNNSQFFHNTIIKKDLDDFEKMKQKYFPKNFFITKSPSSEYKVKYLNNYFNKNSLVKNLFGQYKDKNTHNIINEKQNLNLFHNNINESPFKANANDINSPKLIYKNNIEFDMNNTNNENKTLNFNNRYNNDINNNINEQSLNCTNRYSIKSMKNIRYSNLNSKKIKTSEDNDIEKKYNNILNSINEKLYKNKYKKTYSKAEENNNFIKTFSSDNLQDSSNIILDKNKSYNISGNRFNRFKNFKLTSHFFYRNSYPHRISYL